MPEHFPAVNVLLSSEVIMKRRRLALLVVVIVLLAVQVRADGVTSEKKDHSVGNAPPEAVEAWRKMKFGMFIHWGPVSLEGTEIGWSRGGLRRGRRGTGTVPVERYDSNYKRFDPTKFNADEWVKIANDAGMKYMVFTTKHHDGFCMFDTKLTDYKITSPESPYGRDIVKQLSDACHEGGLPWGVYYSQTDWHHPDYRNGAQRHKKYIEYLHGQVREVLSKYGKTIVIWFDGLGGKPEDWDASNLHKLCRECQPGILINNRCGRRDSGDFDTPEQRIGKMQTGRPWETCMTICRQWAWKPHDELKSFKQCIQTLARVVGGDGNLLFNVGPMPDGRIEPRQVERLKEMGAWLKKYGESIYDTRGGPFRTGMWGASTHRGDTIYLHILEAGERPVMLPPIKKKILSSKILTGGTAKVEQTDEAIAITLDKQARNGVDAIVMLKLDGPADEADPGVLLSDSVAFGKKATASNTYRNLTRRYGPAKAVDDDPGTRWASGRKKAWIEVDLGKPVRIDGIAVLEGFGKRVQRFKIEVRVDGAWRIVHQGARIGERLDVSFAPVTATAVRLDILEANEAPTICELRVFAAKK
jgi:alpha-L-fucosidase